MGNDLVGQTLLDRYRVQALVGHGGMADVYRVFDNERAVTLAIKVLRPDLAGQKDLYQRFEQEAQLLQELSHPHIVRFYEWCQTGPQVFIVMEYVKGSNLQGMIRERGRPFSLSETLTYFRPVCAALHYAHQKAVFHCDVKPSNILLGQRDGDVYVSDFGVARIRVGVGGPGTPHHMAPEQVERGRVDARTDIYALGIVLYELATGGKRPFTGKSPGAVGVTTEDRMGWEHINLLPPSPRQFNASVPPALEAIILRALAKPPQARFASTLSLLEALEAVAGDQPTAPPMETPTRSTPISRNTPPERTPASRPTPPDRPPQREAPPPPRRAPPPEPRRAPIPPRAEPSLMGVGAYVLVLAGDCAGRSFAVTADSWVIGRGRETHLRFSSAHVSRRHAMIRRGKGYYYVQDLESTLGTYVNGQRIRGPQALRSGDIIRLGDVELEFRETR